MSRRDDRRAQVISQWQRRHRCYRIIREVGTVLEAWEIVLNSAARGLKYALYDGVPCICYKDRSDNLTSVRRWYWLMSPTHCIHWPIAFRQVTRACSMLRLRYWFWSQHSAFIEVYLISLKQCPFWPHDLLPQEGTVIQPLSGFTTCTTSVRLSEARTKLRILTTESDAVGELRLSLKMSEPMETHDTLSDSPRGVKRKADTLSDIVTAPRRIRVRPLLF